MKSNELRLGNYVQFKDGGERLVLGVTLDNISSWPKDKSQIDTKPSKDYEPIPLTIEWLLKLGFDTFDKINYFLDVWEVEKGKKYEDGEQGRTCGIEATLIDGAVVARLNDDNGWIISRDLHFVHEVQNLYSAISGEELKIK